MQTHQDRYSASRMGLCRTLPYLMSISLIVLS